MKKIFFLSVLILLMVPFVANAEMMTITGKVTGLSCLLQGFICPVDQADPMINLERDFVVQTATGDYYFLENISLGLKGKYALQVVEATGDVNARYKTMRVKELKVGGKVVWDANMQKQMEKNIRPPDLG